MKISLFIRHLFYYGLSLVTFTKANPSKQFNVRIFTWFHFCAVWSSWAKVQRALSSFQRHVTETHTTWVIPNISLTSPGYTRNPPEIPKHCLCNWNIAFAHYSEEFEGFLHELRKYTMAFSVGYFVLGLSFPIFFFFFDYSSIKAQSLVSCYILRRGCTLLTS